MHFLHPPGTIVSHTGHDHAHGIGAGGPRGGAKQNIDGWSVTADKRTGTHGNMVTCATTLKQHVLVAGCDQHMAPQNRIAILCFLHLDFA